MLKKLIRRVLKSGSTAPALTGHSYGFDTHGIETDHVSRGGLAVCEGLQQAGYEAYIVGGAVRDMLLARDPKDFDVATSATPEQVVKVFRRARVIGRRFKIVHVMVGREQIEVTTFRAEKDGEAKTDEHGRVLADNTYGTLATDAVRRDLTVNAMYFDPSTRTVLDFHGGITDLKARTLRMIGDPATRYREDPVRMLRIARFAAKLDFKVHAGTLKPIAQLKSLVGNCPPSRLFDEVQKLLMMGYAVSTLETLHRLGLSQGLLPVLDMVMAHPEAQTFVQLAMRNTDERVHAEKSTTPAFLFASLLWYEVLGLGKQYLAKGESPFPARELAMNHVLEVQCDTLAIPRRYTTDMREIWTLQLRLENPAKRNLSVLAQPRFRAAYDFFMLRCEAGEQAAHLGALWTELQTFEHREDAALAMDDYLVNHSTAVTAKPVAKRRRVRKPKTAE